MNGIGVWHQDFAYKNGPVAFFYEARNIPIVLTVSRPDYDAAPLRRRIVERTLRFASCVQVRHRQRPCSTASRRSSTVPTRCSPCRPTSCNDQVRARYGETHRAAPRRPASRARRGRRREPAAVRVARRVAGHVRRAPAAAPAAPTARTWAVRADATPAMAMLGADEIVFRHDATGEGFVARRDHASGSMRHAAAAASRQPPDRRPSSTPPPTPGGPPTRSWSPDEYWRDQFDGARPTRLSPAAAAAGRLARAMRTLQRLIIPALDVCPEVEHVRPAVAVRRRSTSSSARCCCGGAEAAAPTRSSACSRSAVWSQQSTVERPRPSSSTSPARSRRGRGHSISTVANGSSTGGWSTPRLRRRRPARLAELGAGLLWFRLTLRRRTEGRLRGSSTW